MHWIEKIDLVKKKFSVNDFKDPFRSGKELIRKIVLKLFNTTRLKFYESDDRVGLLNQSVLLRRCNAKQFYNYEMSHLNKSKNFWLLMINVPMGSNFQVYDCKLEPIQELLYLSSGQVKQEFCIIDKKYAWLLLYKVDRLKDIVEIYKVEGGRSIT